MLTVTPTNGTAVNATYDALGRMVEQQRGSTYTQILYSPVGKTALMNGSTLIKAFVPLPGGGTAIYNSSGLAYYRHPDWLGSSRLSSTATAPTSMYSSQAYAPFGEQYATSGAADPSFTGQNSDTVSSLYDFTFREQSMNQGRWISPDPLGMGAVNPTNPQTWNRYAYVANKPLGNVDPLGLYQPYPGQCDNPEGDACGGGGGGSDTSNCPAEYPSCGGYYLNGGLQISPGTASWLLGIGAAFNFGSTPYFGFNNGYAYFLVATADGAGYYYPEVDYGTAAFELGLPTDVDEMIDGDPEDDCSGAMARISPAAMFSPFRYGQKSTNGSKSCAANNVTPTPTPQQPQGNSWSHPFTPPTCHQWTLWAASDAAIAAVTSGGGKWWNPVSGTFTISAGIEGLMAAYVCQ